ncbi:MAG TPA: hypothetical protein PLZ74_10510 [Kiritimatiellia bacterium]|nr:hypothetical protein [Kiritimatiellia bacterium]HOR98790.1 hypothetical protein [Kiritimatiellia bacterium]HPC48615.1 hypothetical protein [Kiritimatiellia bacterium]
MAQRTAGCRKRVVLFTLVAGGLILSSQAAWIGAGTAGGDPDATDINDANNWQSGVIDGDFRTVVSNVDLRLTADYTATNGLDFSQTASVLRHITISGTNTLTLNAEIPYYNFNKGSTHVFLPSNTASTVTLKRGLTLSVPSGTWHVRGYGTLFIDAKVTGKGKLNTGTGSGRTYIVLRNGTNDFRGGTSGDTGRYNFTSIGNSGVPSAVGASGDISPNNAPVAYIGSRSRSTDRLFQFNHNGARLVNDSACGSLNMLGIVRPTNWGGNWLSPMSFDGISSGETLVTNNIANGSSTSYARLCKLGSGTLRLTGSNTFFCTDSSVHQVELLGGTLIADYADDVTGAGSNRLFLAGHTVSYDNGHLVIRGKTGAGNTTWQEFGTNTIGVSNAIRSNVLTVDGNGGDGTTVQLGLIDMPSSYSFLLIERLGNASVRTAEAIPSDNGSVRVTNGLVMCADGTRANILVKDPDGRTGFAVQDENLGLVRHTGTIALTPDNATAVSHVSLASDLTRTANLTFSTLDIDASANPVTLNLNGFSFQTDNSVVGRGIVINGSNPVAILGGAHGAQSTHIYNYGTDKFTWGLTNSSGCTLVSAGPGLTEITQPVLSSLYIVGGVTRLSCGRNYTEGAISIHGDGVLEIGADLNGASDGDFSRWSGTSSGQIGFIEGGGFSAYGADRTVIMNDSATRVVTWGESRFMVDGKPFVLSSPYANATLIFANAVNLGERAREFRVRNGSAAVDACLTNRIYGIRVAALVKSGDGTLELKGPQDYPGECSVIAGGLKLGADDVFTGGVNALVLSGATLDAGTFRNTFNTLELLTDSVIEAGDGSATLAFADSSSETWTGTLTINGKLTAKTLRFGTDGKGLSAAQLASITNRDRPVTLDEQGYLRQIPAGTVLLFF